jgi:hypothetical protein
MFAPGSRIALAVLVAVSAAATGCSRAPRLSADLVVTHAKIWTGVRSAPEAAAVAIIGGRIVDVGVAEEIERWRARTASRGRGHRN